MRRISNAIQKWLQVVDVHQLVASSLLLVPESVVVAHVCDETPDGGLGTALLRRRKNVPEDLSSWTQVLKEEMSMMRTYT